MQTPKASRGSPKESPQKASVRPVRQLKINPAGVNSPSSSSHSAAKTPKDRSPKIPERKSPRSPLPEKKRPSRLSELESQISQLQDDLKKVKDQLVATESLKREAQEDAEEVKRRLADVLLKLEESRRQVDELVASKEASFVEIRKASEEENRDKEEQRTHELDAAHDEIRRLKLQFETAAESQGAWERESESTHAELQDLKGSLAEALSLVESMKLELKGCRESEAQAQELVGETLLQLEAAKETINALRSDVVRSGRAYESVATELEESRARVSFLESFASKLTDQMKASVGDSVGEGGSGEDANQLVLELQSMKAEVEQLKRALEASKASAREAELEAELKRARADVEELRANMMDKENELQGITEENERLSSKIERSGACQREHELEDEARKLREHVAEMRANLMDKETELQNVSEENKALKQAIVRQEAEREREGGGVAPAEVEALRAAEQDAMAKLGYMMEEREKSNRKAARVTEQLEAAQAASAEMESELRRLKVQSDQWRKAAEAAASMLSPTGNGKYVERTGSMTLDGNYSPIGGGGRMSSPYMDDYDDDSYKKKNGNVLKKIGVLWKKPHK